MEVNRGEFEHVYHALAQWADNERNHHAENPEELTEHEIKRLRLVDGVVERMERGYALLADPSLREIINPHTLEPR